MRRAFLAEIAEIPVETIFYVDETGLDEAYCREKGRAKRGAKVYGSISGRKFKRSNIVAAQCCGRIVAPMEYDGTTDHNVFETWFEKVLLTELPLNSVVVMDNATFHRKSVLLALAHRAKSEVKFLPPYSPDLNPIENTWANLKAFLRRYAFQFNLFQDAVSDYFQVV